MTQGGNDPLTPLHRLSTASLSGVVRAFAYHRYFRFFLSLFFSTPLNEPVVSRATDANVTSLKTSGRPRHRPVQDQFEFSLSWDHLLKRNICLSDVGRHGRARSRLINVLPRSARYCALTSVCILSTCCAGYCTAAVHRSMSARSRFVLA